MNRIESAIELFLNGSACSQAILATFGKAYGLDPQVAMRLASGFAGGMRKAETCGAVTGAFMVLGLSACRDDCDTSRGRKKVYAMVKEFAERFENRNGSTCCRHLLSCDISTPEGMKEAKDRNLFKTTCVLMVRDASEILEEMLELT